MLYFSFKANPVAFVDYKDRQRHYAGMKRPYTSTDFFYHRMYFMNATSKFPIVQPSLSKIS